MLGTHKALHGTDKAFVLNSRRLRLHSSESDRVLRLLEDTIGTVRYAATRRWTLLLEKGFTCGREIENGLGSAGFTNGVEHWSHDLRLGIPGT